MSKLIEIDLRPDEKTLRQFGFIAFFGFGFVAAIAWYEALVFSFGLGEARPIVAGGFAGLGVLALLLGLVWPKANLPIYVGLTIVAYPIGFVLSFVILGVLFYLVLTPVGLFFRLIGRDGLQVRPDPSAKSFWIDREGRQRDAASYFKQF